MGFSTSHWLKGHIKMKFIVVACLFASVACGGGGYGKRSADAEPEADAALLYGAYGYSGYPYTYGAYPYSYGGYRYQGKRSADAEPEADAALLYGAYGYAGYAASPYTYGYSAYPYSYGGYPYI